MTASRPGTSPRNASAPSGAAARSAPHGRSGFSSSAFAQGFGAGILAYLIALRTYLFAKKHRLALAILALMLAYPLPMYFFSHWGRGVRERSLSNWLYFNGASISDSLEEKLQTALDAALTGLDQLQSSVDTANTIRAELQASANGPRAAFLASDHQLRAAYDRLLQQPSVIPAIVDLAERQRALESASNQIYRSSYTSHLAKELSEIQSWIDARKFRLDQYVSLLRRLKGELHGMRSSGAPYQAFALEDDDQPASPYRTTSTQQADAELSDEAKLLLRLDKAQADVAALLHKTSFIAGERRRFYRVPAEGGDEDLQLRVAKDPAALIGFQSFYRMPDLMEVSANLYTSQRNLVRLSDEIRVGVHPSWDAHRKTSELEVAASKLSHSASPNVDLQYRLVQNIRVRADASQRGNMNAWSILQRELEGERQAQAARDAREAQLAKIEVAAISRNLQLETARREEQAARRLRQSNEVTPRVASLPRVPPIERPVPNVRSASGTVYRYRVGPQVHYTYVARPR